MYKQQCCHAMLIGLCLMSRLDAPYPPPDAVPLTGAVSLKCRLQQTPSVNTSRPDEFSSDFMMMTFSKASASGIKIIPNLPASSSCCVQPVSCLIKVCTQDSALVPYQLPDLVSKVSPTHSLRLLAAYRALCSCHWNPGCSLRGSPSGFWPIQPPNL